MRDELLCNIHFTDVETEANKVIVTQDFTANEGRVKMIPGNSSMNAFSTVFVSVDLPIILILLLINI